MKLIEQIVEVASPLPWKKIGIAVGVLAILAAIWFVVIKPRVDLADERVDRAQTDLVRQQTVTDAQVVVADAQSDVATVTADVRGAVAQREVRYIERDRVIREQIIEQAAEDGDPFVSDGMDKFLKELGQ